jgi:hypothetical protein
MEKNMSMFYAVYVGIDVDDEGRMSFDDCKQPLAALQKHFPEGKVVIAINPNPPGQEDMALICMLPDNECDRDRLEKAFRAEEVEWNAVDIIDPEIIATYQASPGSSWEELHFIDVPDAVHAFGLDRPGDSGDADPC